MAHPKENSRVKNVEIYCDIRYEKLIEEINNSFPDIKK